MRYPPYNTLFRQTGCLSLSAFTYGNQKRSSEAYKLINVGFLYGIQRTAQCFCIVSNQYDVVLMNTNAEREQELLPVRIPLCRVIGLSAFYSRG